MRLDGARFPIALPTGQFAYLIPGSHIQTHNGRVDLPGFDVLFLDITNALEFLIAGQAQVDDYRRGTWEWADGEWEHVSQAAPGSYPVIYARNGSLQIATPEGNGSQGWRYVDEDGRLVTGDDTLNAQRRVGLELGIRDLWEFSHFAGVTIGQGDPPIGCHVLIDGTRRLLEAGDIHNIRVRYAAGVFAIAYENRSTGKAVIDWYTRTQLAALPLVSDPQPPTEPVMNRDEIQPFLNEVQADPNFTLANMGSEDETRARSLRFLTETVKRARRSGLTLWALLKKPTGLIADILVWTGAQPPEHVDVIGNSEGHNNGTPTLTWGPKGPIQPGWEPFIPPDGGGPEPPLEKHAYDGGDNDTGECDVILSNGQKCNQPPNAAIHQVTTPPTEPPTEPPPNGDVLAEILYELQRLNYHLGVRP